MPTVADGVYVKYPQLQDEAWLRQQYVTNGLSARQVGDLVGCGKGTVEYHLHRLGIPIRGRHYEHWNPKQCARCGQSFIPSGPAALFCSPECRAGTGVCQWCSKEFALRPAKSPTAAVRQNKFCSKSCWRAWQQVNHQRVINQEGYVTIRRPATMSVRVRQDGYVERNVGAGTPGARKGGRVLEHRLVMEQLLGRPLTTHETIHHINGDKQDNRPENLQLRNGRHGKGSHFQCGDCGSRNIVAAPI